MPTCSLVQKGLQQFSPNNALVLGGVIINGDVHSKSMTASLGRYEGGSLGSTLHHPHNRITVVYSVTWPLNGSEARGELVLIKTPLPLLCKSSC